jgi:hypothetical protein
MNNEDYQVAILAGKDKEEAIFKLGEISKEINRRDDGLFWQKYSKKKNKELSEMEFIIALPRLLKRIKKLGVAGCIERVSISNIMHVGGILIRYLNFIFSKILKRRQ